MSEIVQTTENTGNTKKGWKTTEFWTSIITAGFGVSILLGFFTNKEASDLLQAINNIVGGIMSIGPVVGYALSRGRAKNTVIDPQVLIELLSNVVKQSTNQTKTPE